MEKRSIKLPNGETYFYIEYGSGDQTLILLHGNLSSCIFYKSIIKDFDNMRVIAVDMRGFGDSTYHTPIESMEDFADDLHLFLEQKGISKINLLGWSAGGAVAMRFAAKYPQSVEKLILKASASYRGYPIFKKDENNQPIIGSYYETKEEMAKDPINVLPVYYMLLGKDKVNMKIVYDMLIYNLNKPKEHEYRVQLEEIVKQRNIIDFDWALTSFNMSNFTNGVTMGDDTIKDIKCPVLSLWGNQDRTVLEYMIDETVEAIENIKKVVIEDAGHSIIVDQPIRFVDEVSKFIKE